MSIEILPYDGSREDEWEKLCRDSTSATLLHTRRFLSYHGNRFNDRSALILSGGKLLGVFPAAESRDDKELVVSHPGATYGGIIHRGGLRGAQMIDALAALSSYYRMAGYRRLLYKVVPYIYAREPSQDDIYALCRIGARRVRCDLSSTIDLSCRGKLSERRRRGLKKAAQVVAMSGDDGLLDELWMVVESNLAREHGLRPVHAISEIRLLMERFPKNIHFLCGMMEGKVEAGAVFFKSDSVWHAQYTAASEKARTVSALDLILDASIAHAQETGVRYFDFGISTEAGGQKLNEGLYQYKAEFGSGGVAYEQYEVVLDGC